MRSLVIAVTIVFLGLARASAQQPAEQTTAEQKAAEQKTPADCTADGLEVVPKDSPPVYRLSHSLKFKVTAGCLARLRSVMAKARLDQSVRLYLNDKPLPLLPVELFAGDTSNEQVLAFTLARNARNPDSRTAWDRFLGAESHADFEIVPALSIGGEPAVVARKPPSATLRFGVASQGTVVATLVIGILTFVMAFLILLTRPATLRDEDGRFSLGKSQMAFWGLLVFIAVVAIWFVTWTLEPITNQVLTLMGISAATGVGAVSIGASKQRQHRDSLLAEKAKLEVAKSMASPTFADLGGETRLVALQTEIATLGAPGTPSSLKHFFRDICDDGHGLSFHRFQAAVWTLILGIVFVGSVGSVMSMPTFDDSLLILMGISAGTYLGFKIPEQSK